MRLKSKYVNKTVDPTVALTEDEKLLGRSIFSTQEEEEEAEEVFNDGERTILFRMNIQSLAPGLEIDTSVIDAYAYILNYEEKFKMTNMKRHFFYTSMMVPGILEDKTKEIDKKIDAQYDKFHEMLSIQMQNGVEKMQMEDVELAFFPIIAHGHYYLIVFNLKTGKAVIIDNSESDATYEGKYKDNVEFVLYEGSTATHWKTCLMAENDKNHRMHMDNLRSRIAAKMLLHEVNIFKKKMYDYATKMTEAGEGGSNQQ
ncbi:peptidase C48, SUMO/sentrin/Ubl1 [Tanacetum coccineum]